MTSSDLQNLFITTLVRNHGCDRRHWRLIVGDIRIYSVTTHPHCNWSITPAGSSTEIDRVETLADHLRGRHAIVSAG